MTRPGFVRTGAVVIALVGSMMSNGVASAGNDLVGNGSFERPALEVGHISRAFVTGEHLGRWDVTFGSVFVSAEYPGFVTPPAGTQVMNLRPLPLPSLGDAEICQTVSVAAFGPHKIRFLAASMLNGSNIEVFLAGQFVAHVDLPASLPAQFELYELTVTAGAGSQRLCLRGHPWTAGSVPLVDAVRMKPVGG